MLKLFVGTDVSLGSATMQAFVDGRRTTFIDSAALCVGAAVLSFVRGKEKQRAQEHEAVTEETSGG